MVILGILAQGRQGSTHKFRVYGLRFIRFRVEVYIGVSYIWMYAFEILAQAPNLGQL